MTAKRGASVEGEPNPQCVSLLAGLGTELIQLDVQKLQVLEESLV